MSKRARSGSREQDSEPKQRNKRKHHRRQKQRQRSREKTRDHNKSRPFSSRDRSRRDRSSGRRSERGKKNRRRSRSGSGKSSKEERFRRLWQAGSDVESPDLDERDKEGLVDIRPGEFIRDRFEVKGMMGQGTFGTVLDVFDTKHQDRIALKVVRSVKRYLKAAHVEVEILEQIRKKDVNRDCHCVRLYCTFEFKHRGQRHVCLGFERLGKSLYDFIKKNDHRGFPLEKVRTYGFQLLKALAFCHETMKLIHTDLKPENILLTKSEYKLVSKDYRVPLCDDVKLIDFGGATFEDDHHSKIINTRQYRSPEVLLGLDWSYPSDMWSVGCILPELFTGELLFRTHNDLEHLALIEKVLERPLPREIADKALEPYRKRSRSDSKGSKHSSRSRSSSRTKPTKLLNTSDGKLKWPEGSSDQSVQHVASTKSLTELLPDPDFADLVAGLLEYEPEKRLTAREAMNHRFFDRAREAYEARVEAKRKAKQAQEGAESADD